MFGETGKLSEEIKDQSTPALAKVYIAQGHLRAQVIKSKLEAAGIPVLLSYDSASLIFGLTVNGIGEVRIMVPKWFVEEAQRLLAEEQGMKRSED